MRCTEATGCTEIKIGRTSENDAELVRFNVADWPELYGSGGSFVLVHQRPGDEQPYVCAASVAADGWLEWVVKDTDLQTTGRGEAQLTYVVDSVVAKSVIFTTRISRSLGQAGELPEPYENMIDELIEAAANITTEANRAETARTGAETAQGKAEDAQAAAETAQQKAEASEDAAKESEENAAHYADVAQQGAETSGYVYFDVDNSDGHLYVTTAGHIGEDVDFEVNEESGNLEVIYT